MGARTIWIDSMANVDKMSMAGRLARRYSDLWLTQWPHLGVAGGSLLRWSGIVIFVAVGTQLPFDRLIAAVDAWAGRTGRQDVLAQIGPSKLCPQFIEHRAFFSPAEFSRHVRRSRPDDCPRGHGFDH